MSTYKIIFIHGYTASSKADWYPVISPELENLSVNFSIPDLPGGDYPNAEEWLEIIHRVVTQTTKPIVFVGHSLGTRAVLLYLEKYQQKVEKVFLIAAFANDGENAKRANGHYSDFFEHPIDLEKIKLLVGKFIIIHSEDDSSIDYQQGVKLSRDLNAELITATKRDHFSDPENAPYILDILKQELGFYKMDTNHYLNPNE